MSGTVALSECIAATYRAQDFDPPLACLLACRWEMVQEGIDIKTISWAQH